MTEAEMLASWHAHMERCLRMILGPIGIPDAKVTIVVRAPEALPGEAMISSNDDFRTVARALEHFAPDQDARRTAAN